MFANIGPQLSDDQISLLFEKFYRADPSRSAATGGAGIGTGDRRDIVEMHGGTINAVGQGKRIDSSALRALPKNTVRKVPLDKA